MSKDVFLLDTQLSAEAVVRKVDGVIKANRSLRFVRPVLAGQVGAQEISLWRDRRNWNSSLYPVLRITVRPKGAGAVLEGRFGYHSIRAAVVGLCLGGIAALSILVLDLGPGVKPAARALAAIFAVAVFPLLAWAGSRFSANLLSGDRELLFRELSEIISDEGV